MKKIEKLILFISLLILPSYAFAVDAGAGYVGLAIILGLFAIISIILFIIGFSFFRKKKKKIAIFFFYPLIYFIFSFLISFFHIENNYDIIQDKLIIKDKNITDIVYDNESRNIGILKNNKIFIYNLDTKKEKEIETPIKNPSSLFLFYDSFDKELDLDILNNKGDISYSNNNKYYKDYKEGTNIKKILFTYKTDIGPNTDNILFGLNSNGEIFKYPTSNEGKLLINKAEKIKGINVTSFINDNYYFNHTNNEDGGDLSLYILNKNKIIEKSYRHFAFSDNIYFEEQRTFKYDLIGNNIKKVYFILEYIEGKYSSIIIKRNKAILLTNDGIYYGIVNKTLKYKILQFLKKISFLNLMDV